MNELEDFEFRRRYEQEQAQKQKPESPTIGNLGSGFKRGITDVLDTIATQGYGRLTGNKDLIGGEANKQESAWEAQNPDMSAKFGRLAGNLVATAPVAPLMGEAAGAAGLSKLATALRSGGFSTGTVLPESAKWIGAKGADMALKMAAGGAGGAASSALVSPKDVGAGAIVGALLPPAIKGIGVAVPATIKNTLGLTTGVGAENVAQAYQSGKSGKTAFMDNLTGKVGMADVLDTVKQNAQNMGAKASADYRSGMIDVKGDKSILDFNGIDGALKNAYESITFKGQPKNVKAAEVTNQIADEVSKWKSLDPAEFHTPEGLDALKQRIGGIIESIPFEDKTARMAASNVYNSIKDEISKQAPTYSKTMKNYSDSLEQIKEIERTLSLNPKASVDTSLRKLQSLGRNNVNTNYGNRLDLAKSLEQAGGNEFLPAIAGQSMNSWASRGLVGQGGNLATIGSAFTNPAMLGLLPLQSPKAVGAMSYGVGKLASLIGKPIEKLSESEANQLALLLSRGAALTPTQRQDKASQ
jgi:hypothetical protein